MHKILFSAKWYPYSSLCMLYSQRIMWLFAFFPLFVASSKFHITVWFHLDGQKHEQVSKRMVEEQLNLFERNCSPTKTPLICLKFVASLSKVLIGNKAWIQNDFEELCFLLGQSFYSNKNRWTTNWFHQDYWVRFV